MKKMYWLNVALLFSAIAGCKSLTETQREAQRTDGLAAFSRTGKTAEIDLQDTVEWFRWDTARQLYAPTAKAIRRRKQRQLTSREDTASLTATANVAEQTRQTKRRYAWPNGLPADAGPGLSPLTVAAVSLASLTVGLVLIRTYRRRQ